MQKQKVSKRTKSRIKCPVMREHFHKDANKGWQSICSNYEGMSGKTYNRNGMFLDSLINRTKGKE